MYAYSCCFSCFTFLENIGHSQLLLPTSALSHRRQLLSDASLARPAEPVPGGRQLCKSQIKHNLYNSHYFRQSNPSRARLLGRGFTAVRFRKRSNKGDLIGTLWVTNLSDGWMKVGLCGVWEFTGIAGALVQSTRREKISSSFAESSLVVLFLLISIHLTQTSEKPVCWH